METIPLQTVYASLPEAGRRRLEAYLGNVERGFDEQLETPFFKGDSHNPTEYGQWYYDNIAKSGIPELDAVEQEEIEKFTPFSVRLPWTERAEGAREYFATGDYSLNPYLRRAFDRLVRVIPKHSLKPSSFKASFDSMPKDSNLGLPWFSRDKEFLDDYLSRANHLRTTGWKDNLYPAVIGWRGQSSDDPDFPKQRVVWMMDHLETIVGLSLQMPVLDKLKGLRAFAAWNELSIVDKAMTNFIDKSSVPIMSADFSGFDKTFPKVVSQASFDLLRYWFTRDAESQIAWLEKQFHTVSLVNPMGQWISPYHGVPSGSALTNLIDSLGQLLMVLGVVTEASVLGDDGVYLGVHDPDQLSSMLKTMYGVQVSADKGGYSRDEVRFLQRLHLRHFRKHGICVGIRSLVRTWKGACYLERRIPDLPPAFFSARTISQLENAKHHPRFPQAVTYFFENDEVLRRLDPVETFRAAGGVGFVEKTLGLDSYKFGKELPSAGLDNFETVKLLRKLRSRRPERKVA